MGIVGHSHRESYETHNSMTNPEKPIMFTTVSGSATNMGFKNPSFMLIDLDAETMLPVNMHSYYMDLDEANETG